MLQMKHIASCMLQVPMRKGSTFFGCKFTQRIGSYLQIDWQLSDDMFGQLRQLHKIWQAFFHGGPGYSLLAYLEDQK